MAEPLLKGMACGTRVLFLEDDPLGQWTHTRLLELAGCTVVNASTCAEAEEIWASHAIDFVVMDYRLPDGNAVELIDRMRKRGKRHPVICLTAEPGAVDPGDEEELGITALLAKPVDPEVLHEAVKRAVSAGAREDRPTACRQIPADSMTRVGRFWLAACPSRVDVATVAAFDRECRHEDWLALDMRGTRALSEGALAIITSMGASRSSRSGRLCIVAAPDSVICRQVARKKDACLDVIDEPALLDSAGRRLNSGSERMSLLACPVGAV